jgi:hypothetical protein
LIFNFLETKKSWSVWLCDEKRRKGKGKLMRKMLLMLSVLLLGATAFAADVTISCSTDGNEVTVSYQAHGDANIPRGLGLNIELACDANITATGSYNADYWVYPGSIDINTTVDPPVVDSNGSPVAVPDPCNPGRELPGPPDANGMTIEMGSLHYPPEVNSVNAPDINGVLLKFYVDASADCNVVISGNAARGNVVLYDATEADVLYTGCTVTTDCLPGSDPGYALWVTMGKPKEWCCKWQSSGDATGDGNINVNDLLVIRPPTFDTPWTDANYDCRADFDHDGNVNINDLLLIRPPNFDITLEAGYTCPWNVAKCPPGS